MTSAREFEPVLEMPWEITGFCGIGEEWWFALRVEKGFCDVGRLQPGASAPELEDRYAGSLAALAFDGSGFWMCDLRGPTMVKVRPRSL